MEGTEAASHINAQVTINAPIGTVWEYYTTPEHIVNWNFASEDWHCPRATNPLRTGATFSWRMEAKDGSTGFDFTGMYIMITPLNYISYKLEDGRIVIIHFDEDAGATTVKITAELEYINDPEIQRIGWQTILTNFKTYVTQL